jgi:hypothetical protein
MVIDPDLQIPDLFDQLLSFYKQNHQDRLNKILNESRLYFAQEQDAERLEKRHSVNDKITPHFFSADQIVILFNHWRSKVAGRAFFKLASFLNVRIDPWREADCKFIEDLLWNNRKTIKLEKLIDYAQEKLIDYAQYDTSSILPVLCGSSVLRVLKGKRLGIDKKAKIQAVLEYLNHDWQLGWCVSFLARRCSANESAFIMNVLKACRYSGSEVQKFLITILESKDSDKIQSAFSIYWTYFKQLNKCKFDPLPSSL